MKVKELIEYLSKCNSELRVVFDTDNNIDYIMEHRDIVNPDDSYVELS